MSVLPPVPLPFGAIPLRGDAARAVAAVRLRALAADLPDGLTVRRRRYVFEASR